MKRVVFVICGGPSGEPDFLQTERERHQPVCLICADSGARHLHVLGLTPDLIVGDMDSLDGELQRDFVIKGSRIMRYPEAKDETDSELALQMAFMMAPDEIRIYGALGARIDHTLANLTLLATAADKGIETRLLDEWCEIFLVRRTAVIAGEAGQTVSLFAFGADVTGVTLEGFEYPLRNATITPKKPIGISNCLTAARGIISVGSGDLLAVRYFKAGHFPQRA
ncbi:MAG: thiamine diphosphokinase [Syntrophus sp. (in: bacteria)]|nr:thiamine diphosphokinase [Syntrophus sp. (in: bacteria)]